MTPGIDISLKALLDCRHQAKTIDLSAQQKIRSQLLGGHLSSLRGRGIDFDEVRAYQSGDDIRAMDWRVTARTGKPHVKLYHEERERPVFLFVDFHPSMFFGTKVAFKSFVATKAAALLGWAAIQQGDRLGGVLFSPGRHLELRPRARQWGILPLLKALCDFNHRQPSDTLENQHFDRALLRLRRIARPGSLIFLISDFYRVTEEAKKQLNRLSENTQMVACLVRDPMEISPPRPGRYLLTDGEQQRVVDTTRQAVQARYSELFQQRYDRLQSMLHKRHIPIIELRTDQPVATILQREFS